MYSSTHSLTSALDGGVWSASRPGRFTSREKAPDIHWIGGWVGPRAVLDAVVKRKIPSLRRESNPSTLIVQPVVQRYTDWAITALRYFYEEICFTEYIINKFILIKTTEPLLNMEIILNSDSIAMITDSKIIIVIRP
jgi:hypothetical protein